MPRSIVNTKSRSATASTRGGPGEFAAPEAGVDDYADRLLKLIPGEVITVYLAMITILKNSSDEVAAIVPWLVVVFGVAATWFYLRVTLKVTNIRQLLVTCVAFLVWAFTIGPPFDTLDWYNGTYAGLLLAAYTFIAPKIPLGD